MNTFFHVYISYIMVPNSFRTKQSPIVNTRGEMSSETTYARFIVSLDSCFQQNVIIVCLLSFWPKLSDSDHATLNLLSTRLLRMTSIDVMSGTGVCHEIRYFFMFLEKSYDHFKDVHERKLLTNFDVN